MADINDDAVVKAAVRQILLGANLKEMTLRKVMLQLAARFCVEVDAIAHRKRVVRACINDYLEHMEPGDNENGGEAEDEGGGEEEAGEGDEEDDDDQEEEPERSESLGDVSDDEPEGPRTRKRIAARTSRGKKKARSAKSLASSSSRPPAIRIGLQKAVVLSPPLAELLGARVMSRQRLQQWVISYVKDHQLQDPNDRRTILADEALQAVFKVSRFTFFSLSRLIAENVSRADDVDDEEIRAEAAACDVRLLAELRAKREEDVANGVYSAAGSGTATPAPKKRKLNGVDGNGQSGEFKPARLTGLNKAVALSPQLAELLGSRVMSRNVIRERLTSYVKERDLQDKKDRRWIVSDEALQSVFGVSRFTFFGLSKMIAEHVSAVNESSDAETRDAAIACDEQMLAELDAKQRARTDGGRRDEGGGGGEDVGDGDDLSTSRLPRPAGARSTARLLRSTE